MPLSPQDKVRQSIALTITDEMAERLLQHDKANPAYRLSDLRDADERAIFLADVLELLSPERRAERAIRLNVLRGHGHALAEKDEADLAWQARQDVVHFGQRRNDIRARVMTPGYCHCCRQPVITDKVVVFITDELQTEAHGQCCAADEDRFELISQFAFSVKGGQS